MLQVLDDVRNNNKTVAAVLNKKTISAGILDCPDTASSIADVIDFKMLHLFHLQGDARYQVNWVYYPLDIEDIFERVFLPSAEGLIDQLHAAEI